MKLNKVFTIGYQNKSIDTFIAQLRENGINLLIDARARTNSRKLDFSKTKFKNTLSENGIEYQHEKSLGTPAYLMKIMKEKGHYSMSEYEDYLDANKSIVNDFLEKIDVPSFAIMCYEEDPLTCHRLVLARRMSEITNAEVVNIL